MFKNKDKYIHKDILDYNDVKNEKHNEKNDHINEHNHNHNGKQKHILDHNHNHIHNHKEIFEFINKNEKYNKRSIKIFLVLILNLLITIFEILGGILSKSLSLISDSFHNFADSLSILLSYIGIKISLKPKDLKKTYGYKRGEIVIAFINSLFLILICLYLIYNGIKRFFTPEIIDANVMFFVSIVGFFGNLFSIILLKKEQKESLNIKSSYLHLFSDTLSSVGVIIGSIFIRFFKIYFIDSILTIIIAFYIIYESFKIFLDSLKIFMQSSADIDYYNIKEEIEKIEGIKDIHHMHSWLLDEKTIHFEAHIELEDMMLSDVQKIFIKVEKILKEKFNISHVTLQPEINKCCQKMIVGD